MAEREGILMEKVQIEVPTTASRVGAPYPYPEEWVFWYPRSSNHKSANANIFRDVYFLCRDPIVLDTNAYELF